MRQIQTTRSSLRRVNPLEFFASLPSYPPITNQSLTPPPLPTTGNMASGGLAGASSLTFVYSLDYARTRLANDSKGAKKGGGERQFNGLVDVYRKTLASDGIAGLYRGFAISCVGIVVYRGLYFGLFDSIKPVLLTGTLEDSFLAAFLLGWGVTIGAGGLGVEVNSLKSGLLLQQAPQGEMQKPLRGSKHCLDDTLDIFGAETPWA